jgi:ribose transport system substrate-binding protein
MRQRRRILMSAVVIWGLVLAGCAGTSGAGDRGATIAFAQRNFASDWWAAQTEGVRRAANDSGAELLESDGRGDPVVQNSTVQNYITRSVGAVILNPADPRGVAPSVQALKKAQIPLIAVNSNLDPSLAGQAYCYVAEDQVATASKVGAELANVLTEKYGSARPLKAAMVGGFPGEVVTDLRSRGFVQGYESSPTAPKLDMLPMIYGHWVADQALASVREVATGNPDLTVLFVASDSMLPAVQSALTSLGLWNKVVIGTYDGAMSTVKYMIDNPDGPIFADGANLPAVQGKTAVEIAAAALRGEPQSQACPGGTKYVDTPLYTPKNAAEFYNADQKF